ncbi:MAG: hypothetical protein E7Z90_04940 [Cyanobacteria bacterium SIG29]|nr:hypothetical protein [Cyanobacteria bacterium SIG29]
MINPAIVGAAAGTGIALGGSKVYQKVTGKPAGAPASIAHVLTNDKLDSKAATIGEMTKEGVKDLLVLGGGAATVGGAAAIATGCSNKVGQAFAKGISKVGDALSKIAVNGKNLKDLVKSSSIYTKFSALPAPAKAAILAGAGVLALVGPLVTMVSAQKAGYIEGKHEINNGQ